VIFTNSNELADDIIRRPGLRVVRGIDFDRLKPADFQVPADAACRVLHIALTTRDQVHMGVANSLSGRGGGDHSDQE
jgi:hypothetical protein